MIRLLTTCVLLCLSTVSFAHEGAEGVVKERMDRFKENKKAMKAIKGSLAVRYRCHRSESVRDRGLGQRDGKFFP